MRLRLLYSIILFAFSSLLSQEAYSCWGSCCCCCDDEEEVSQRKPLLKQNATGQVPERQSMTDDLGAPHTSAVGVNTAHEDLEKSRTEAARKAEQDENERVEAARKAEVEKERLEAARKAEEEEKARTEAARKAALEEKEKIEAARKAEVERERLEAARKEQDKLSREISEKEAQLNLLEEQKKLEALREREAQLTRELERAACERQESTRRAEEEKERQEKERQISTHHSRALMPIGGRAIVVHNEQSEIVTYSDICSMYCFLNINKLRNSEIDEYIKLINSQPLAKSKWVSLYKKLEVIYNEDILPRATTAELKEDVKIVLGMIQRLLRNIQGASSMEDQPPVKIQRDPENHITKILIMRNADEGVLVSIPDILKK